MVALDASVLAYAINRFAPEHARAARVLDELANGAVPWALPWPEIHGFLAQVTHRHIVARPLSPGDAWAFIETLRQSPSLRLLAPTERHAAVLAEVIAGFPAAPGRIPGLETAVILREHGVRELLSADRGMRRFGFLAVRDPIHGELWVPTTKPERRYRKLTSAPRPAATPGRARQR